MTNIDLQTIGVCLQALFTGALAIFAWRGLSAWKAQSRATYRLEVLRNLSRDAFCVVARVHDARGRLLRYTRPEDVINWPNEQRKSAALILREAADQVSHSNDILLQTLVEARGGWNDDTSLQKLGKSLAAQVRDIHGAFRTLIIMLEAQSPGMVVDEASQRKAIVQVCIGRGEPEPTPETEKVYDSFKAFLGQIEREFRVIQN